MVVPCSCKANCFPEADEVIVAIWGGALQGLRRVPSGDQVQSVLLPQRVAWGPYSDLALYGFDLNAEAIPLRHSPARHIHLQKHLCPQGFARRKIKVAALARTCAYCRNFKSHLEMKTS